MGKALRQAEKAAHKAAKMAHRHAKQATWLDRAAQKKAEMNEQKAGIQVLAGKLVNWTQDDDAAATLGDLTILPSGRICFHAISHPGNLRVSNFLEIQKSGGRGPAAQFEAVPTDKPGVYQLRSFAQESFLGVAPSDDFSLESLGGVGHAFVAVDADSSDGLWSFYPEGNHSPLDLPAAKAAPGPRECYQALQTQIQELASATNIPISIGDAPDDEAALVDMLTLLHSFLPHGLKRIAMKQLGLREFDLPEAALAELQFPEEWVQLLEDLRDMGFDDDAENRSAVQAANGELKHAVKHLVQGLGSPKTKA